MTTTLSPIDAARALAAPAREAAAAMEAERRCAPELAAAFAEAGLFRLCVPRSLGGVEADPATIVRVIEEISTADASAGWCLMIGVTTGIVSGYLSEDAAREIYGRSPTVVTGGAFAPLGRATITGGGYRVSGRWPFGSGSQHCAWLMGGSVIVDGGKPRLLPSGAPDSRMMIFPASEVRILDTWTVSGLRGTGSHDFEVADVLVPAERSISIVSDRPREPGPLYKFPVFGLLALGVASVALGIARRAIDELADLAGAKVPTGSRRKLAERAMVQVAFAESEAALGAARAFLLGTVGEALAAAEAESEMPIAVRTRLRLAATHAARSAAAVVDRMYEAGGATSIYATSPLQRCFRDVHALTQHVMVAPITWEMTGRLLLGNETDISML
jgi:alkylation response protein AidB-like acyl-CoA dehydrogenase